MPTGHCSGEVGQGQESETRAIQQPLDTYMLQNVLQMLLYSICTIGVAVSVTHGAIKAQSR